MPTIDRILADVERLLTAVKPREAEAKLRSLLETMGDDELQTWAPDLRLTVNRFLPKRRRALLAELDRRLQKPEPGATPPVSPDAPLLRGLKVDALAADFSSALHNLSESHIYQWSTFYRQVLSEYFDRFTDAFAEIDSDAESPAALRAPLRSHAEEIFRKGFSYVTSHIGETEAYAITKSLNGLQRFLDLPIEAFAAQAGSASTARRRSLRVVCSGMARAILEGYSAAEFGHLAGHKILPRYPRSWAHSMAFLTGDDLAALLDAIEPGDFRDGARRSLLPLAMALDHLSLAGDDYVPLTALSQLNWESRRLDISIQPPPHSAEPRLFEIQCYLEESFVNRHNLSEAANRDVALLVAPLRPDLRALMEKSPQLKQILIPCDESVADPCREVLAGLEAAIYRRRSPRAGAQALQYNFAREFPLHNPFLTRYFHVHRSSVRELLRAFERRNGVRLWCSVRRSGKTTACTDLGTTTGRSAIVNQTCAPTGQVPGDSLFYESVCEALAAGRQIAPSYLERIVDTAIGERASQEDRVVLVLDEYETLFGRLKSAAALDQNLRYAVVQPLLSQMVAFSRENLLVFLGQQPNAHFILMDQNQLSAYIEQDSFPLFSHEEGATQDELSELVRKVMTERTSFDSGFVDCLYRETAGHPFLTVNLLVEFVEWLIDTHRPVASLHLDEADFEAFSTKRLGGKEVSMSREYIFFREAIRDGLSQEMRQTDPWLHGIYTCIRGLALESPETYTCSRSDFDGLVEKAGLPETGMEADLLLTTGSQANFFDCDDQSVRPKIKLLARLASISKRRVSV